MVVRKQRLPAAHDISLPGRGPGASAKLRERENAMASLWTRNRFRRLNAIALALGLSTAFAVAGAGRVLAQSDSMPAKTIDLNLNNAPVRQALNILFQGAGLNYTMDPNVSGYVNVNLRGVSFETALKAVLKSASPPLVAVKDPDTGVYYIKVKDTSGQQVDANGNPINPAAQPQNGAPAAAPVTPAPATYTPTTVSPYQNISMSQFETITLKYLPAEAMSQLFGAVVIFHTASSTAGKQGNSMSFGGFGSSGGMGGVGGMGAGIGGGQMGGMTTTTGMGGQTGMTVGGF